MKLKRSVFILALALTMSSAFAGVSNNVPMDDQAYDDVDRLIGFGFARDSIFGHRPWSEAEFLRLARHTKEEIQGRPDRAADLRAIEIAERLIQRFDRSATLFESASFSFLQLNSSPRDIPVSNGIGTIDGFVHPLVEHNEGLDFVRGQNFGFETEHAFTKSPYFASRFHPSFRFFRANDGSTDAHGTVQELYIKTKISIVEIELGRDQLLWGQSPHGGLMLSDNARGLDMLKLSNDVPFIHPWFFKYLGPSKYAFFVSNLGPDRTAFPNAFLYGAKLTVKPFSMAEVGFSETIVYGGDGAPPTSWSDSLIEFFPVTKIGRNYLYRDVSDHRFGFFDARLTLPWLNSPSFYFESMFDDSPSRALGRVGENFWIETAMTFGLHLPQIIPNGRLSGNVEYRHIPPWAYRHYNWTTGYTLNRRLLGDPLGPDADGYYLDLRYIFDDSIRLKQQMAYECRRNETYDQTRMPNGSLDNVVVATPGTAERRFRTVSNFNWKIQPGLEAIFQVGYEYVKNFNFANYNKNNFMIGVKLNIQPEIWAAGRSSSPRG